MDHFQLADTAPASQAPLVSAYTSLEALLHDAFWAEEGDPVELPLMEDVLREYPGPSLEVGSGSGRLLLPLLERGFDIEGLELSKDMLDICRCSAADRALDPILYNADMTRFDPGKTYASLLVPAFTLQLAADPIKTLNHFKKLLRPEGALYLSVFIPLAELHGELPEGQWYDDHRTDLPDGRSATVQTRHHLDRKARILVREHRYRLLASDGSIETEHTSEQTIHWFTAGGLRGLLAKTGFHPVHALADFDPELPVDDEAQIITLVARC